MLLSDKASFEEDYKGLEKEISLFDSSLLETKKIFHLLTKVGTIDKKNTKRKISAVSINKSETIEALKEKIFKSLE